MQEITLINDGTDAWPSDVRLHLFNSVTDIPLLEDIPIHGQVLPGVSVKISMKIDARQSKMQKHFFSYKLCYGPSSEQDNHTIGEALKF